MTLSPYAAPGIPRKKDLSLSLIEEHVCRIFGEQQRLVHSKSHKRHLVLCRQVTMMIGRQMLNLSYNQIAEFYDTDHSSTIHNIRTASNRTDTEPELAEKVKDIKQAILFS